jgi:alpha-glucosidase
VPAHEWWQRGVVYHVYPRSFADGNGDGVGDLPGLTRRLAYLRWLGVDAVWLSPVYRSPMKDFGYDISAHTGIDPLFGDLQDFDAVVAQAHRHGLRLIVDYVPNHTSDEHPWFLESRASRDNPKRDWYRWRDPGPNGAPPNNWLSLFGGSAWTLDQATGQCYYHAYLAEQPDLNWTNPAVRDAMLDVMRFWLDRGVDGFRVDALRQLAKDPQLRDNPPNPAYRAGQPPYDSLLPIYSADRDEVLEAVVAMRDVLGEDRVLIGEVYVSLERLMRYYGTDGDGVHMPSNMHLIATPWHAERIADLIERYEAALPAGAWPNWVLGNHDRSRIASRVGAAQARVAAMLLLTLRGTPTLYYGDELGMRDARIPADRVQDPYERNVPGIGVGRDPARTPMPWTEEPNGGFCPPGAEPWLPIDEDTTDVAAQRVDPHSILTLYRRLLALRRAEAALSVGSYRTLSVTDSVLAYARQTGDRRFAVALNLGGEPENIECPHGRVALSTHLDREGDPLTSRLSLRSNEGVVVELLKPA